MGHRTEGLEKFARDIPDDRCFSIVFKDQRNTLDLIAPSSADAQHWVQGLHKIIHHSGSMDQQQKLQQYPPGGSGSCLGVNVFGQLQHRNEISEHVTYTADCWES